MKYFLILTALLTLYSCSNSSGPSGSAADALKDAQVSSLEINRLNLESAKSPNYQLSKDEIETLYKEGIISKTERDDLLKLTI